MTAVSKSSRPVLKREKKGVEKSVQAVLDAWIAIGKMGTAKVHGSSPLGGRYPAEGLEVSFSVGLDFPPDVDDSIEVDPKPAVAPYVATLDDELADILADAGYSNLKPYWDSDGDGFTIAHHFPPMWGNEPPEVLRCFRAVTAEEKNDYEKRTGEEFPPFSDEQWVELRYAGINMFRTVEWRPK